MDSNGDSRLGPEDWGIPGIQISLANTSGSSVTSESTTITDRDGRYAFSELDPGTYRITKRQSQVTLDGQDTRRFSGAQSANNAISNIVLQDDQQIENINFPEKSLKTDFIGIGWFFASTSIPDRLREIVAIGEDLAGNATLASSIRLGNGEVPVDHEDDLAAANDFYEILQNNVLTRTAAQGVLANDTVAVGHTLTAALSINLNMAHHLEY